MYKRAQSCTASQWPRWAPKSAFVVSQTWARLSWFHSGSHSWGGQGQRARATRGLCVLLGSRGGRDRAEQLCVPSLPGDTWAFSSSPHRLMALVRRGSQSVGAGRVGHDLWGAARVGAAPRVGGLGKTGGRPAFLENFRLFRPVFRHRWAHAAVCEAHTASLGDSDSGGSCGRDEGRAGGSGPGEGCAALQAPADRVGAGCS